ncbi:MAG: PspC domain-containing protein [Protaetiibacter sp.]
MARRTTASPPPDEQAPEDTRDETIADATTVTATAAPAEHGFFAWLRGLGLPRRDGWLGGVCGGIAARIGIDPLIVRGIVVVLAVIGAPVALLYAIAWFLLPDEQGTIHAQQLGHGHVTRALPGILAVFLLSFLPLTQSFWFTGALYWGDLGWSGALGRGIWTGVLLILVVVVVVWLARRSETQLPTSPATTDDRPDTVPRFPDAGGTGDADAAADTAGLAASAGLASFVAAPSAPDESAAASDPGEPPAPPTDASAEELAAWKQSQDEWQRQRAVWAAEQRRSERERRQAEANARAQEALEASRERARIRKLTRPRASAGIVFLVLGVALLAGAISAFAAAQSASTRGAEWMVGAAELVLVLGTGTVVVALGRRRSGALAFFSILSVLALVVAVVLPTDRTTLPPGTNSSIDTSHDGRYAQLGGSTSLYVSSLPDGAEAPVVDLWQLLGGVTVDLADTATVRIELTTDSAREWVAVNDNSSDTGSTASYEVTDGALSFTAGSGDPDLVLRVWLGDLADLSVNRWGESDTALTLDPLPDSWWEWDGDGGEVDLLNPTPTPIPSDGTNAGGAGTGGGE